MTHWNVAVKAEMTLEAVETLEKVQVVEPIDESFQAAIPRMIPKADVHSFSSLEHQHWNSKVFFKECHISRYVHLSIVW